MKRLYVKATQGDLFAQPVCRVHGNAIQSIGNFMFMVLNPVVMFAPVLYLCIECLTIREEGGLAIRRRLATCCSTCPTS